MKKFNLSQRVACLVILCLPFVDGNNSIKEKYFQFRPGRIKTRLKKNDRGCITGNDIESSKLLKYSSSRYQSRTQYGWNMGYRGGKVKSNEENKAILNAASIHDEDAQPHLSSKNSLWPPWPFSILQGKDKHKNNQSTFLSDGFQYQTEPSLFLIYVRERAKLGIRQLQQCKSLASYFIFWLKNVTFPKTISWLLIDLILFNDNLVFTVFSDASFHLPPAGPVLLPLAIIPIKQNSNLPDAVTDTISSSSLSISSLFSASPRLYIAKTARRLSLASLSVAVLSWAHYEVRKNKRLVPLPLPMITTTEQYDDSNNAGSNSNVGNFEKIALPPFLPERVPPPSPLLKELVRNKNSDNEDDKSISIPSKSSSRTNQEKNHDESYTDNESGNDYMSWSKNTLHLPKLRKQLLQLYDTASKNAHVPLTLSSTIKKWQCIRSERRRTSEERKRNAIFQELVEYQSIKKKAKLNLNRGRNNHNVSHSSNNKITKNNHSELFPLGYALVTGASRGLGRALAVELARWEIPLILIARDGKKLNELADDIEACYGVKCCIIEADLSKDGVADKIYQATTDAGMHVDILVNNAGVCHYGEMVDSTENDIDRVLQLNAISVAKLSHLYGKDMKNNRRGRILFVSSIVGALPSGPGVATYAATKAFEKSLALSMGKELETYGVGVTCLMPGAIKDTSFAKESKSNDAICWKIPFYCKTAPEVASKGIHAMLSGDAEVVNGWQNRLLVRVAQPILPQRLTSMIVETSFKPLRSLMSFKPQFQENEPYQGAHEEIDSRSDRLISKERLSKTQSSLKTPLRTIKLKEEENINNINIEPIDDIKAEIVDDITKGETETETETDTEVNLDPIQEENISNLNEENETEIKDDIEKSLQEYQQKNTKE